MREAKWVMAVGDFILPAILPEKFMQPYQGHKKFIRAVVDGLEKQSKHGELRTLA